MRRRCPAFGAPVGAAAQIVPALRTEAFAVAILSFAVVDHSRGAPERLERTPVAVYVKREEPRSAQEEDNQQDDLHSFILTTRA